VLSFSTLTVGFFGPTLDINRAKSDLNGETVQRPSFDYFPAGLSVEYWNAKHEGV
jgi:hypothetical protein